MIHESPVSVSYVGSSRIAPAGGFKSFTTCPLKRDEKNKQTYKEGEKMTQNLMKRSSGILMHPTSLPGKYGMGDLGPQAYKWIDRLAEAKQKHWQILPLGPTGYGDSPYQCFSAFAGNPYLISPELLIEYGLLRKDIEVPEFPKEKVDFGWVIPFKVKILKMAWGAFKAGKGAPLKGAFEEFCKKEAYWLDDYALFMALKEANGGVSWLDWNHDLRHRETTAMQKAEVELADEINSNKFSQFLFFKQWMELKQYANNRDITIIGDIPIFISSDSSDLWSYPEGFLVDEDRRPTHIAGVPPDYFSATGQLWGNPLYNWEAQKKDDYAWWKKRLTATLELVDYVRIDHFRGFEAYWKIPAGNTTAENGIWEKGPYNDFFDSLKKDFEELPIIAEDLGVITAEVDALREHCGFPGMKVLQFAFGGGVESRFLPHNYEKNCVVYTGTHDNDTTKGFYAKATDFEKDFMRKYMGISGQDISWDLIRLASMSVADLSVYPLQDILSLGSETRMNLPGALGGNWEWRFTENQIDDFTIVRLRDLTEMYGRG